MFVPGVLEIAELERRMRPGAWSDCGFLGATERLSDVLAADERTLCELGVSCEELAGTLTLLLEAPRTDFPYDLPQALAELKLSGEWARMQARRAAVIQRFGSVEGANFSHARVGGRYEVELHQYGGRMTCPWSRPSLQGIECGESSTDWRIRDVARGLELSGPTLITHLIGVHGFFEGFESKYRVEPRALAELLELGPFATPALPV